MSSSLLFWNHCRHFYLSLIFNFFMYEKNNNFCSFSSRANTQLFSRSQLVPNIYNYKCKKIKQAYLYTYTCNLYRPIVNDSETKFRVSSFFIPIIILFHTLTITLTTHLLEKLIHARGRSVESFLMIENNDKNTHVFIAVSQPCPTIFFANLFHWNHYLKTLCHQETCTQKIYIHTRCKNLGWKWMRIGKGTRQKKKEKLNLFSRVKCACLVEIT